VQRLPVIVLVAVLSATISGCGTMRPVGAEPETVAGVSLARPYGPAGHRTSLRAAETALGFSVPQPDVRIAGPSNLTAVWIAKPTRQVALVYGSGDVTVMMARAPYTDPRSEFSRFLRENHAKEQLGSVDGNVALVIWPHSDANRSNPAWVEFDRHGIDVNVVSATRQPRALLAVARSLWAS
jgi:hypothetical protein